METIETNLKEKNILFYKLDLNISLIFQLTKSKNKFILPKVAKRDQFLGVFFLITWLTKKITMRKILSWSWILQNLEVRKHEN